MSSPAITDVTSQPLEIDMAAVLDLGDALAELERAALHSQPLHALEDAAAMFAAAFRQYVGGKEIEVGDRTYLASQVYNGRGTEQTVLIRIARNDERMPKCFRDPEASHYDEHWIFEQLEPGIDPRAYTDDDEDHFHYATREVLLELAQDARSLVATVAGYLRSDAALLAKRAQELEQLAAAVA